MTEATTIDAGAASAHHFLGYAYFSLGKRRRASQEFQATIKLQSQHAESRYLLGLASLSLGRRDEAIQQFRELELIDPKLARQLYQIIYQDKLIDANQAKRLP